MDIETAMIAIAPILKRVENGNEETLRELAEEFEGIKPTHIRVPESELDKALLNLDPKIRSALETAIERIKKVHAM